MRISGPGTGHSTFFSSGFTLVEALVVCAIAAALIGAVTPAFGGLIAASRANNHMLELRGLLEMARSTAVLRQTEITLCGTNNASSCSNHWERNRTLVFQDINLNRRADNGEFIVAISEITNSGQIRWRASGGRSYLRFDALGGVKEFGNFLYCPPNGDTRYARQIILSASGRARSAVDTNGDGIREDAYGNPLSCL